MTVRADRRIFGLILATGIAGVASVAHAGAASSPVAIVGAMPISLQTYRHWSNVERHAAPHTTAKARRLETMNFLISSTWVEAEAAADGIVVTAHDVNQAFNRLRRENFKTTAQFRRFLRGAGETEADVKYRTRLDLLSQRLQMRNPIPDLAARWKPQTRCAPSYMASDCGGTL
jgi:hypothetical protein